MPFNIIPERDNVNIKYADDINKLMENTEFNKDKIDAMLAFTLPDGTIKSIHFDHTTPIIFDNTFSATVLISTILTGTAPFSIASTTLNPNLNADMIDGFHVVDNDDLNTDQEAIPTRGNVKAYIENFNSGLLQQTEILQERIENAENKIADLIIETSIITGRQSLASDYMVELFKDTNNINAAATEADVMDKNDFNQNWIESSDSLLGLKYKQGYARPAKQYYKMELIDRYDLTGVGQINKNAISAYDSTRDCYWLLTNKGTCDVGAGEIIQLDSSLSDGKVIVKNRWWINKQGAPSTAALTGIEVDETNNLLLIVACGNGATTNISGVGAFTINTNGTLGLKSVVPGGTLTLDPATNGTNTYDNSAWGNVTTNYFANDICIWDTDTYVMLCRDDVSDPAPMILQGINRGGMAGGSFGSSWLFPVTGLEYIIRGNDEVHCGIHKNGNDVWITMNDGGLDNRFIYYINITKDLGLVGPGDLGCNLVSISGRFESSSFIDFTMAYQAYGITTSKEGNVLEIISTGTSEGQYIAKRAWVNSLWAENQVSEIFSGHSNIVPGVLRNTLATPVDMYVEANRYVWIADYNVTATQVDLYRIDLKLTDVIDADYKAARIINAGFVGIYGITADETNDRLYILTGALATRTIYYGSLSAFIALMTNEANPGANITLGTTWGTIMSGAAVFSNPADSRIGLAYDTDRQELLILNSTNNTIERFNQLCTAIAGTPYNLHTPGGSGTWGSLAYKNNSIFIIDRQSLSTIGNVTWQMSLTHQSTASGNK
ncbi:MAG: hypothetical protein EHM87_23430, partial [Burkholderiales bacterium]